MNCSIVQLTKKNKLTVIDQLADKSISSKAFFDNCFLNLKQQMRQQSLKGIKSQMRYDLYQVMNNDANPNSDTIKETWNVNTMGSTIQLNMKSLGAEEIASSVLEKLKRTSLVDKKTSKVVEEINDILICSDAVIYEYLEPLLRHYCNPNTQITFIDNDCSVLGASFLASGLLKVKTFDLLPFPIGMGLYNGVNKFLIEPKTSFPCIGENIFQTITNNQKTIRVNVYEGESTLARNCKQICEIVIDNLRPAPAGRVKLNIQIEFDENGVLKAFATDLATKKELEVFIDIYSLNFLEFKRDPNEYQVDIDQKLNHTIIARDYHIAKFLEDLDFYLEYLLDTYNFSPQRTRSFIERKIYLAKKYVSKNRLKIGISECNQLADELEQIVNTNKPSNLDKKELDLYDKKNMTAICTIL